MLSASSDNCGISVTVSGSCGVSATVTKTASADKAVTVSNCCMVVSDGIPTTSCGRFEGDDGGGDNEGDGGGSGIICDSNNGVIPMDSIPSSSSSTSSSSGLGPAGVMSTEGTNTAGKDAKEDLGPVPRDRCNTWPMRRPELDINAQTSPLIHEQIPEEETDLCDNVEKLSNGRLGTNSTAALMGSPESSSFSPGISSPVPCGAGSVGPVGASSTPSDASDSGIASSNKKSTTRRNAWGNMSYADLITQAIVSSPEKRLTLSQGLLGFTSYKAALRSAMEARDSELNPDDCSEFERRGRSHTWPERQLVRLELDAVAIGVVDAGVAPRGCTPDLLSHGSSASISATSSASLTEALKSNLNLLTEPELIQESEPVSKMGFSKGKNFVSCLKIPFRTQSDMQLSGADIQKIKSSVAVSFPHISRFSAQNLSQHITDALPSLSLSHSPSVHTQPEELSYSTLDTRQSVVPASNSTQLPVLKLVSAAGSTSDLLPSSDSSENLPGCVISSAAHLNAGSVQNLAMPSTDPKSNLGSLSADNNSTSHVKCSSSSSTSITADLGSNVSRICTTSQVLSVPYFTWHTSTAEKAVKKEPEVLGVHEEQRAIKKKRVRKRLNGLMSIKKPNPWGAESYSDLIARALKSAFDGRMRLNEIYNWFASNVPYFGSRTSQEQSAGWKNSIRHNLSLHSRFMRIQNEGAGKSSWWVINPDAKPGRNSRRQRSATLETTTKVAMDKKRRGARKKVMEMRASAGAGTLHSAGSSIGSQASVLSRELYTGEEDSSNFESFRSRTQSNLSMSGSSSRVSPSIIENYVDDREFDNFDFPPFVEAASAMPHDILDRTNEMNLNQSDSPAFHRPMANPILNGTSAPASSSLIAHMKTEPSSSRTENNVQPPPSYHELDVVRGVQNIQNPLLRTHLIQNRIPNQHGVPYSGSYSAGSSGIASSNWMHSNVIPVNVHPSISCAAQQSFSGSTAALPMDLENLALPDQPLMEVENMEAVIRHELSQSAGSQLSFDNI